MSTKKKVQFHKTKRVKKFVKNDEDHSEEDNRPHKRENENDEYYSDEDTEKKPKHSLDSDEEDNTEKYEILNKDIFKTIGQENKTKDFDGDIKITPFNMKEELEEGNFDTDGYYHWKSKEKDELKDAWLDNLDWANINSFRKAKPEEEENKKSQSNNDQENSDEEESVNSENDDENFKDDESGQLEIFKKIITYLKPNETILKAIKRLGNQSKSGQSSGSSSLSASQRWLKKKNTSSQDQEKTKTLDNESAKAKEDLESLTGYANYFIDRGYYDIYEETYEKIEKKIQSLSSKDGQNSASSLDIFADDEKDLAHSSGTSEKNNLIEDTIVKWIYKLTNSPDAKTHGPYTSQQMFEKSVKGEFTENGVWCKRLDEKGSLNFYNSKRIDFDLYS